MKEKTQERLQNYEYTVEKPQIARRLKQTLIHTIILAQNQKKQQRIWGSLILFLKFLRFSQSLFSQVLEDRKFKRNVVFNVQLFVLKYLNITRKKKARSFETRLKMDSKMVCMLQSALNKEKATKEAKRTVLTVLKSFQMCYSKFSKVKNFVRRAKLVRERWNQYISNMRNYERELERVWNESINLYFLQINKEDLNKIGSALKRKKVSFDQHFFSGELKKQALLSLKERRKCEFMVQFEKFRKKLGDAREKLKEINTVNAFFLSKFEEQKQEPLDSSSSSDSSSLSFEKEEKSPDLVFYSRKTQKESNKLSRVSLNVPELFLLPSHYQMVSVMVKAVNGEIGKTKK